ncbi:hypothetical protein VT98_10071, partial [Candidatus Electrothrix communis]
MPGTVEANPCVRPCIPGRHRDLPLRHVPKTGAYFLEISFNTSALFLELDSCRVAPLLFLRSCKK